MQMKAYIKQIPTYGAKDDKKSTNSGDFALCSNFILTTETDSANKNNPNSKNDGNLRCVLFSLSLRSKKNYNVQIRDDEIYPIFHKAGALLPKQCPYRNCQVRCKTYSDGEKHIKSHCRITHDAKKYFKINDDGNITINRRIFGQRGLRNENTYMGKGPSYTGLSITHGIASLVGKSW